jgi:hypothetical protein
MASAVCPNSQEAPLLGVIYRAIRFGVQTIIEPVEVLLGEAAGRSGRTIGGQGFQAGSVQYDIIEPPQEAQSGE